MEGVGDRTFRRAIATIGGFSEAVTGFLRVSVSTHVQSLASSYLADEIKPIPLAPQIMGSDPDMMVAMVEELEKRGAQRIDLNCGCPSKRVTGRGAGSSLLKDPNLLYENAKAIVEAVSIPITVKMRSGYKDISLFKENLLAAQESGISYITLHPRTKVDGYSGLADWDLIAEAKQFLRIPVVGNGDILSVADALKMLSHTKCDALMIGRGALINPFIFHQIRSHFSKKDFSYSLQDLYQYIQTYLQYMPSNLSRIKKIGKMKQLLSFLFKGSAELLSKRQMMLRNSSSDLDSFVKCALSLLMSPKSH